jgi:hypothetical protein
MLSTWMREGDRREQREGESGRKREDGERYSEE